ncbi:MAG TPA: hypothetical protein VL200_16985 [Lacunisphaera sp.]|jgi:hypothetical protein|nr:hypothetical protein [Lacunisphaera sp.]
MKTSSVRDFSIGLTMAAVLTFSNACSRRDRDAAADQAKDGYDKSVAALDSTWEKVKDYTYEKRDQFVSEWNSANAQAEAKIHDLQANYADAKASASHREAMEELKRDDADYQAALKSLGSASANEWDAAKEKTISAWHKLQAAYDRARAD